MDLKQKILLDLPVGDPDDLDFLLEFADGIRDSLREKRFTDAADFIRYAVRNGYGEAFYWAMGILEECRAQAERDLPDFECALGRHIPEYDSFISRLQVDLNAFENDVIPMRDENGEIQSFYNVITYKTGFSHIVLVTAENFDSRDNDFIEYRLICKA